MEFYDVIYEKMVVTNSNTITARITKITVDMWRSRVGWLQKLAFWIVYWMTSNIAIVVSGAAEEN